jgi:hypothetical protein
MDVRAGVFFDEVGVSFSEVELGVLLVEKPQQVPGERRAAHRRHCLDLPTRLRVHCSFF